MKISNEDKKFLELYSDSEYEKPSVTVDGVVLRVVDKISNNYRKLPEKKLQVYLLKRQYPPFSNCFATPGTFIDLNYELSETMKKCAKKKIGLENFYMEQLFTFGDKSRDPRTRVLSVSYMLLLNQEQQLFGGEWFDIDIKESNDYQKTENGYKNHKTVEISLSNENTQLNNVLDITTEKNGLEEIKKVEATLNQLAFDHIKLLYYATERLKNKIEYTDIVFNLLPEKFTLTGLKQTFEIILREPLLDANFRRKIAKMVVPTNDYDVGRGHRS
ncbi:MAG: NUDIX hydrolase, partial [Clostridia bacterium]|nr:NUDIX hydrolase [Clostridia bacterium]